MRKFNAELQLEHLHVQHEHMIAVVRDESGSAEQVIDLVDDRREHIVEVKVRAR
jgi:hypothetical protein